MSPRRSTRVAATVCAAVALGAAMTGCDAAGSDAGLAWAEPGWMAQFRQDREEHGLLWLACMEEQGVAAEVDVTGAKSVPDVDPVPPGFFELTQAAFTACDEQVGTLSWFAAPLDGDGRPIAGIDELLLAASDHCEKIERPSHWRTPLDQGAYARMLDVRECVIAHGFDVQEPPSFDVWVDQGHNAWGPFHDFLPGSAQSSISDDDLEALFNACPQTGNGFVSLSRR